MNCKRSHFTATSSVNVVKDLKNAVFNVQATAVFVLATLPVTEQGCCQQNKHTCMKSVRLNIQ